MMNEDRAMEIFTDYLRQRLLERMQPIARKNQVLDAAGMKQITDELAVEIVLELDGDLEFVESVKAIYDAMNSVAQDWLKANKQGYTNPPEHRKYKHKKATWQ